MKRLAVLVLFVVLLAACSTGPSEVATPTETPITPETTAETPPSATPVNPPNATPVNPPSATPVPDVDEHDHEHFGEVISEEAYQAILDAATVTPIKVEYVNPETGIAYGTLLEGDKVRIYSLLDGQTEMVYEVDKETEWVDINAMIGNQLVILEKNPTTRLGRVFLLDVETKEETDILNEEIYHGPVTSEYIVRDGKVFFTYDKNNEDIAIVSYDPATKELETVVEDAFDLKLYQDEMYYLKLVDTQVGLYKLTVNGQEVEVVEPGLNLYDYYFVDGKLDLLTFILQVDTFYYLRISDFFNGGPMAEFVFVQPNIMGEDVMIGTAEHQTLIQHGDHIHALPEFTMVGQDTYFTYDAQGVYYFVTVNNEATTYYSITKDNLLAQLGD